MVTFNRVFCEIYQKQSVKSEVKNGLAFNATQKISVIALEIKADAEIYMGEATVKLVKGSKLLVNEQDLHNKLTGSSQMQTEGIEGPFIVIDAPYIVGVE